MNRTFLDRFGQDRVFWLVIGAALLAFVLLNARLSANLLLLLLSLIVAITIHEFAHAWVASLLGDPTARLLGRVSLNPLRHLDPLGSIMILVTVLSGFGIGWGKPVPVTPYRLRPNPKVGNGIVSLSGPASNLTLAVILGLALRLLVGAAVGPMWARQALNALVITNIAIGLFNLIPLPPLDGHSVLIALFSLFKGRWAFEVTEFLHRMSRYGPILLLALVFIGPMLGLNLLGWLVWRPAAALYRLVVGTPIGL